MRNEFLRNRNESPNKAQSPTKREDTFEAASSYQVFSAGKNKMQRLLSPSKVSLDESPDHPGSSTYMANVNSKLNQLRSIALAQTQVATIDLTGNRKGSFASSGQRSVKNNVQNKK